MSRSTYTFIFVYIVFLVKLSYFKYFGLFFSVVILFCASVRYYNEAGLFRYRPCYFSPFFCLPRLYISVLYRSVV